MTTIVIENHELDSDTQNLYTVTIDSSLSIETLVTSSSAAVDSWLAHILQPSHLVVGLDIEWRPNFGRYQDNPAATLQLCPAPGRRCLVFQLIHADSIPPSLLAFLDSPNHVFAGVGVSHDAEKLLCDYGIRVRNAVDLGEAAARVYGEARLRNAGLKELATRVVGIDVEKPKRVTMGRWDHRWLNTDQVRYACVDAYASYAIGMRLGL